MTTINKGDLVLVTGATGFIGAHVVEELVAAGYKVRGTSRSKDKAQFLLNYVEKTYGSGKLEIADVPDMIADGAYDEAVLGVAGIVHLASILTFSNKPDEVIAPSVKGTLNILKSATKEPKVKSLVVTSSSTAACMPSINMKATITKDSWNDFAVKAACEPDPDGYVVYAASKTEAERALWDAVKATSPPFQVSAVLPNANFGSRLRPTGNSTGDWVWGLYNGKDDLFNIPPQYYIDVSDDAKLHVAALVDPSANGQRLFGFAGTYNANDILAVFRKLEPSKSFIEDRDQGQDLSEVPNQDAEALLKKHYGHGWTSLEESLKRNIAPPATE